MSGWKTTGNVNYYDEVIEPTGQGANEKLQGALESTLELVKKSLWTVERNTQDTSSRLDSNNKSGPTWWIKFQTTEYLEAMRDQLGGIEDYTMQIKEILKNSAISRKSDSPLEKSLAVIHKSAVYFNEKTMRWHDEQSNLMVKGSDTRVEAAKMAPSGESGAGRKAVEGEIHWPATMAGFLKEIAENTKEQLSRTPFVQISPEDKMEQEALQENRDRDLKKYRKTIKGRWDSFLKWGKESWFAKNWKLVAAGLALLFTPFKYLKPLWIAAKAFWEMPMWGKLLTVLTGLGVYFGAKAGIKKLFSLAKETFKAEGMAGFKPGAGMTKVLGAGAILAGIALAIKDGFEGAKLSEEWGVGKASGVAGAVLGGTSKGLEGAMANMGKWALIGAGLGSFFPVVGTLIGGLIGAAVGALLGWIGGERIAKFFTATGEKFKEIWEGLTEGIVLMVEDFKEFLIDPILDILSGITKWVINKVKSIKEFFGLGPEKKPIEDTGEYAEGPTPDDIKDKVAKKGLSKGAWMKQQAGGGGEKQSAWMESMGGKEGVKQAYKKYKSGFSGGTTTPTDAPTDKLDAAMQRNSARSLATYREKGNKRGGKRKMQMELQSPTGQLTWDAMTEKEQKRFKLYDPSKKRGGGEDKHKAVKVSGADMSGVSWNKLGGKDTIEDAILTTWNQQGVSAAPTFTSGFRKKDAKESLANPKSQHIQGTAFDLRSKDLGSDASAVWADISNKFAGMGLWGQWEKGDVNAKNRSGEHFHFQLAAKGFGGIVNKATGFIAGEEGPELVNIIPLQSPADQTNAMNQVHTDRATLGGNQASPTIITTDTTTAAVQSNPLTFVSGTSHTRGKPIPTSRGS